MSRSNTVQRLNQLPHDPLFESRCVSRVFQATSVKVGLKNADPIVDGMWGVLIAKGKNLTRLAEGVNESYKVVEK